MHGQDGEPLPTDIRPYLARPQPVDFLLNLRCLRVPFGTCEAPIVHLLSNRDEKESMTKIERFEEQHTDAGTEHCTDKRAKRDWQDTRAFAQRFRVKITQDERRDPIIEGRRGHLYFDEGELCLMAFDARVAGMGDTALGALGGKLWTGDAYKDPRQRRRRDVKIQGIPEANWPAAIRILQIPRLPRLSAEERAARSSRLKSIRASSANGVLARESFAAPGIKVRGGEVSPNDSSGL